MKRKLFLLFILSLLSVCSQLCFAQQYEAPNYAQIRKQISNTKTSQYYPKLMERYEACDTLLSNEDYRLLYYGYVLREDFVPYQEKSQAFFNIRQKVTRSNAGKEILQEAIRLSDEILEDNPFDMSAISLRSIASLQLGDTLQFHLNKSKVDGLVEAIISSGDGETPESAFHVTSVEHEYELTSRLGLVVVKDSIVSNQLEYLRVELPNADDIHGIYFNFDACGSIYKQKFE